LLPFSGEAIEAPGIRAERDWAITFYCLLLFPLLSFVIAQHLIVPAQHVHKVPVHKDAMPAPCNRAALAQLIPPWHRLCAEAAIAHGHQLELAELAGLALFLLKGHNKLEQFNTGQGGLTCVGEAEMARFRIRRL
jgi:hypothetical protein